MRLTDASVVIRPRSAWEAVDLGVLLAKQHAGLLMLSWAIVTLPIFALLCLLLWDYPSIAVLIFWWLKPAYERLPLFILSNALFGSTPSLKQALKALPGLLKPQLLASLTWRRLSPTRSFDLPVQQLEGLSGSARNQRLVVLGQRDAGGASWLTVVGVALEIALIFGLISLFYMLLPAQLELDWSWDTLISTDTHQWLWLEHLSNLFYALVLVLWGPIYVACGFTLYLNRRTALEAWDIELVFRQLRQRLTGVAYALLLSVALLFMPVADNAMAASEAAPVATDPNGPDAPRLLKQPLTSEQSQESITQLLDQPPFEHRETVTRWRFGDAPKEPSAEDAKSLDEWMKKLADLAQLWKSVDGVALFFEVLLWTILFSLLAWLLWRYRDWLNAFAGRLRMPQVRRYQAPEQLFGLEVAPQSLPNDIAGEVERLWHEHPRAALSLLYRALLSRLLHEQQLVLKSSDTEGEVLQQVHALQQAELSQFSQTLTRHWQNLAYGHQQPPAALKDELCTGWRQLFERGAQA